jgi:hypothetical protein
MILGLFNGTVSTAEVRQCGMSWEDDYKWLVYKNLEEGHDLFLGEVVPVLN